MYSETFRHLFLFQVKAPEDKLSKWEDLKDAMQTNEEQDAKQQENTEIQDEPKKDKKTSKAYDIAFICANTKHGAFLNYVIKSKFPEINTNFGLVSPSEELASLDSAKIIVALLSTAFINSGKHVDEYHVALARHRKTKGKPVLYSIQIEDLPKWPTYFHLVSCRIALNDLLWVNLLPESGASSRMLFPKPVRTAAAKVLLEYNERLSSGAMLALSAAADDIVSILRQPEDRYGGLILAICGKIFDPGERSTGINQSHVLLGHHQHLDSGKYLCLLGK